MRLSPRFNLGLSLWNANTVARGPLCIIVRWQMAYYNLVVNLGQGYPTNNAKIVPLGHCEGN
jgi:hypothetical protein